MPPSPPAVNQPASASPTPAWLQRMALLLLLATSAAVRLRCLTAKPFWFDECYSVELARIGWGNFLRLLWWREANMSLYYLLLRIWLHFGNSEFFIRSLSALISAATVPAIDWLARQLYDRRVGLIAAALFAGNAYSVRYAQEARSYALFVLLATLSSGFLVAFLREPNRRRWLGYVLASILAVYAHFYALLLLAGHWLALRLGKRSGPQLKKAWGVIAVAVAPLLIFVAKTGAGPRRWIQRPGLGDLLEFSRHFAGGANWLLPAICLAACAAAVAPQVTRLWTRDAGWETWRCQFLLLWLLFPVLLTVLLSFARPVFLPRYMIFCLPALLILVAAGMARLRTAWLLAGALGVFLLLSGQGVLFVYSHDLDNERDASCAAANFVLDYAQPGDAIVFHIAATRVAYEFFRSERAGENTASPTFARALGPEIVYPDHGAGLDYRDFTGKPNPELLRSQLPSHRRVWLVLMNNGPAGKPDATTVMLTQLLPQSFPGIQHWQFPLVEVRLYGKP